MLDLVETWSHELRPIFLVEFSPNFHRNINLFEECSRLIRSPGSPITEIPFRPRQSESILTFEPICANEPIYEVRLEDVPLLTDSRPNFLYDHVRIEHDAPKGKSRSYVRLQGERTSGDPERSGSND